MSAHGPEHERSAVSTGWVVFALLAVLTAIEYVIGVSIDWNLPLMIAIAIAKSGLIVYYFMHVVRAWLAERAD